MNVVSTVIVLLLNTLIINNKDLPTVKTSNMMVTRIEMQIINWILLLKMQKREPPHTEVTNQSVKITRIKLLKY